jgi:hypothetical protein
MFRRSYQRLRLPSVVSADQLSQAKSALYLSQIQLHQLQLSQKILQYPHRDNDQNTVYRLLLPHITLHDLILTSLNNELCSEQIMKKFSFSNPLQDDSLELQLDWRCERHNNPHMEINSFQAELWSTKIFSNDQEDKNQLFASNEMDAQLSSDQIDSTFEWFAAFTADCLRTAATEGQICKYQPTRRDLSWFLSFLLTHPSDPAFDVVSHHLMR